MHAAVGQGQATDAEVQARRREQTVEVDADAVADQFHVPGLQLQHLGHLDRGRRQRRSDLDPVDEDPPGYQGHLQRTAQLDLGEHPQRPPAPLAQQLATHFLAVLAGVHTEVAHGRAGRGEVLVEQGRQGGVADEYLAGLDPRHHRRRIVERQGRAGTSRLHADQHALDEETDVVVQAEVGIGDPQSRTRRSRAAGADARLQRARRHGAHQAVRLASPVIGSGRRHTRFDTGRRRHGLAAAVGIEGQPGAQQQAGQLQRQAGKRGGRLRGSHHRSSYCYASAVTLYPAPAVRPFRWIGRENADVVTLAAIVTGMSRNGQRSITWLRQSAGLEHSRTADEDPSCNQPSCAATSAPPA